MASISLKYKSKQGTLTAPGDVDPGAMIPIATVTVGSGGSEYIEFTSIPNTYEHLQIRCLSQENESGGTNTSYDNFVMRFNSDTGANYSRHHLNGDGASATAYGAANVSWAYSGISQRGGSSNLYFGVTIIDILDYSNTNKYKTVRALSGADLSGSGNIRLASALWQSTSAITSIRIQSDGAPQWSLKQYSSFALYGVKRAGA
jgi:hypothetical protein